MQSIHRDPTGQVALYDSEGRYQSLLRDLFGRRFIEYRQRWQLASERGEPGDFPLSLDLAINSGCQLHCLMCPLKSRPDSKAVRLMDEALFQRLMAEAKEYQLPALTLGLGSEPLLNPRAAQWAALAVKAGIMDIRLGSNGLALSENMAKALVASGLTRLEISLDAARPESYRRIRGGDLEALEKRVENFLKIRNAAGQKFPLLRLSFLNLPQNQGELEIFLARWQGLADMVSIQEAIWFPGSGLPKPTVPLRPIAPHCAQPWQRLGITHDGAVWPCCSWYGEGLLPFNAKSSGLAAIWRSDEMAALRHNLSTPDAFPAACAQCEC